MASLKTYHQPGKLILYVIKSIKIQKMTECMFTFQSKMYSKVGSQLIHVTSYGLQNSTRPISNFLRGRSYNRPASLFILLLSLHKENIVISYITIACIYFFFTRQHNFVYLSFHYVS